MLTVGEIASMRAVAQQAMPDVCTIQRKTASSDGGGGSTESWATLVSNVTCGIAPVGGGESTAMAGGGSTQGDRIVDETTHVVTLPNGQDITEQDRVVTGGVTYEVLLVRKRGAWELNRRCDVREVS